MFLFGAEDGQRRRDQHRQTETITRGSYSARRAATRCREWGSNPQAAFAAADFKSAAFTISPSRLEGSSLFSRRYAFFPVATSIPRGAWLRLLVIMSHSEERVESVGGLKIFVRSWLPEERPRALW